MEAYNKPWHCVVMLSLVLSVSIVQAHKKTFHERLAQGEIICAEGYLFELEKRGYLQAGAYVPMVVLEHPEVVKQLHKEFVRAGSDVVVALTYYAHRDKMKLIGQEVNVERLNREALKIAKEIADETDTLLAGDICNTWVYNPHDPKTAQEVYAIFDEQVGWAKEEGADLIIAETFSYLGEALIALEVIKKYELPAVITLAADSDKTYDGHKWDDACHILATKGADVVGLNCTRGPQTMLPLLENIVAKVDVPVAALPVPYRTTATCYSFQRFHAQDNSLAFPSNLDPFLLSRDEIAKFAQEAKKIGVRYFGVCCGAQPHYLRSLAEALGRKPEASKYSPDMSKHGMLGDDVREHEKENMKDWQ